jgi:hypothetical protein
MKVSTNVLVALTSLASVVMIAGGAIVLLEQGAPGPALIRLVEGALPDCNGARIEVLGGLDRDRNGALGDDEVELGAVVCDVAGRLEVGYEPEPLDASAFEPHAPRSPRSRLLMELRDHPPDGSCPEGGLSVVVGLDRNRDALLSAAEISIDRAVCGVPNATLYARSR